MDELATNENRIGTRVAVDPIAVVWMVPKSDRPSRLRRSATEHAGRIVDVSVTGAGVEGPVHPRLSVGAHAVLVFDGGRSEVRVRHIQPTVDPQVVVYGVEHVRLHHGLRDAVFLATSRGRSDEDSWRKAW